MGQYSNAIIELGKFACVKCATDIWAWLRSSEEANAICCDCCESQQPVALPNSENPTTSENLENKEDNAQ